jgi:ABC-2 type transport system ATP-binding protein
MHNVTRRFAQHLAVDALSFCVDKEEIFGLLGPNGAGKTTVINMIVGLLRRDAGVIHVLGFDPERNPHDVRRRIGLVPQHTNVYGDLSAADNLWHHAALYCEDLSDIAERIDDLLHLMSLWNRRKDPVRTFSGGMRRRLVLARALLHDPDVIFFDEPTLGVDVQGKHVLWDHIKAQQAEGKTFIISTNDMSEADALCDRLLIIDHGRAIATDTPENLKAALGRDIVTLHTSPMIADPERFFSGLHVQVVAAPEPHLLRLEAPNADRIAGDLVNRISASYTLESIRIARPTLDDVFLHHTGRGLRE